MISVHIYMILTIACSVLFIPMYQIPFLCGSSTIIYAFLLFVGDNKNLAIVCALWGVIFLVALIICYILAWKKEFMLPFLIVAALNIAFVVFAIAFKIHDANYVGMTETIMNLILNCLYYCWIVYEYQRPVKKQG